MQNRLMFKRMYSNTEVDLVEYIETYLNIFPETEIMIGCDSQNYAESTIYAIVVALYHLQSIQ